MSLGKLQLAEKHSYLEKIHVQRNTGLNGPDNKHSMSTEKGEPEGGKKKKKIHENGDRVPFTLHCGLGSLGLLCIVKSWYEPFT